MVADFSLVEQAHPPVKYVHKNSPQTKVAGEKTELSCQITGVVCSAFGLEWASGRQEVLVI